MGFAIWTLDTCDAKILVNTETGEKAFVSPSAHYATPEDAHQVNIKKNAEVAKPLELEFGSLSKPKDVVEIGKQFFIIEGKELIEITAEQAAQFRNTKYLSWRHNEKKELEYILVGFSEEEKIRAAEVVASETVTIKDDGGAIVKQPVVKLDDEAVIKGG